jgi:hypothetical protein
LSLAGCVSNVPLEISSQFDPPRWPNWAENAAPSSTHICHLVLAPIGDERINPQSFGTVNNQTVHASDPTGWVKRAFEALSRDPRIVIEESNSRAHDLALQAELLKAYVVNITGETRSVNVVVRVRYLPVQGPTQEETYRGTDDGVTWGGGQSESQTSFNVALLQIIDAVHRDVVFRCGVA